jgi:hypothetical protein
MTNWYSCLYLDWDARESHFKFMNSPEYGPFLEQLSTLISAPLHLHHITTKPFPPTILGRAPVIEFATFYNIEPGFLSNVEKFVKVVEEVKGEGYLGVAYGETMEDVKKHADQGKGDVKDGKAVVLLIGWESKELHMKFRETDTFKENIHYLREKQGGVEMVSFDASEFMHQKLICVQAHVPFKAV